MKKILLSTLIFCFFLPFSGNAQSAKKMAGSWKSIFRKDIKSPCKFDYQLELTLDGKAYFYGGKRLEKCPKTTQEFASWTVEKRLLEFRGKEKKWDIIVLKTETEPVFMVIEVYKTDIIKVAVEMVDGDTTRWRTFTFKKM